MVGLQKIGSRQYLFDGAGYLQLGFQDLEDGRHYFNSPNGEMVMNKWITIEGEKYYFDRYGVLQTGLFQIGSRWYFSSETGAMQLGMQEVQGRKHYFNSPNGEMVMNKWITIEGEKYYFDRYGVLQTGLFQIGSRWYFSSETGAMQLGMQEVQGRKHYFNSPNGDMAINKWVTADGEKYYMDRYGDPMLGLQKIGSRQYFFSPEGVMQTGFQKVTGRRLCFRPGSGELVLNSWVQVGPYRYYMDRYGDPLTGAQRLSGKQYLFNSIGVLQTGWQMLNGERKYFRPVTGELALNSWENVGVYRYYMDRYGNPTQGIKKIGRYSYFFDGQGRMQTGWQNVGGEMRYFKEGTGEMILTNWAEINGQRYYLDSKGNPVTGLKKIGRYSYFFDAQGVRQTGWQEYAGHLYYFNENGEMQTGWKVIQGKTYYLDSYGRAAIGMRKLGSYVYCFLADGAMVTGWYEENSSRYYFDQAGHMLRGWQNIEGETYYFDTKTGMMVRDQWVDEKYLTPEGPMDAGKFMPKWIKDRGGYWYRHEDGGRTINDWEVIDGYRYHFDGNGYRQTGWYEENGWKFYLGQYGKAAIGYVRVGSYYYLFDEVGAMQTGWRTVNGRQYFFDDSGHRIIRGWAQLHGQKYYLLSNGAPADGITRIGRNLYFFTPDGAMQTGQQTVNGKLYLFQDDGTMAKPGWVDAGGHKYYMQPDNSLAVGITVIDKKRYYFDENGMMQTGWQNVRGERYYFDAEGIMQTGWCQIDGKRYYLTLDGALTGGWRIEGNQYYYFGEDGAVAQNTWIGNRYVDDTGAWVRSRTDKELLFENGSLRIYYIDCRERGIALEVENLTSGGCQLTISNLTVNNQRVLLDSMYSSDMDVSANSSREVFLRTETMVLENVKCLQADFTVVFDNAPLVKSSIRKVIGQDVPVNPPEISGTRIYTDEMLDIYITRAEIVNKPSRRLHLYVTVNNKSDKASAGLESIFLSVNGKSAISKVYYGSNVKFAAKTQTKLDLTCDSLESIPEVINTVDGKVGVNGDPHVSYGNARINNLSVNIPVAQYEHTHQWMPATCTKPQTCSICDQTSGEPLGHVFQNGKCTRCGVSQGASADRLANYIMRNGHDIGEGKYERTVRSKIHNGSVTMYLGMVYDPANTNILFSCTLNDNYSDYWERISFDYDTVARANKGAFQFICNEENAQGFWINGAAEYQSADYRETDFLDFYTNDQFTDREKLNKRANRALDEAMMWFDNSCMSAGTTLEEIGFYAYK